MGPCDLRGDHGSGPLDRALEGVRYVINMLQVGGLEAASVLFRAAISTSIRWMSAVLSLGERQTTSCRSMEDGGGQITLY